MVIKSSFVCQQSQKQNPVISRIAVNRQLGHIFGEQIKNDNLEGKNENGERKKGVNCIKNGGKGIKNAS